MTRNEFAALCGEMDIDPALALENAAVRAALQQGDYEAVEQALRTEF